MRRGEFRDYLSDY